MIKQWRTSWRVQQIYDALKEICWYQCEVQRRYYSDADKMDKLMQRRLNFKTSSTLLTWNIDSRLERAWMPCALSIACIDLSVVTTRICLVPITHHGRRSTAWWTYQPPRCRSIDGWNSASDMKIVTVSRPCFLDDGRRMDTRTRPQEGFLGRKLLFVKQSKDQTHGTGREVCIEALDENGVVRMAQNNGRAKGKARWTHTNKCSTRNEAAWRS